MAVLRSATLPRHTFVSTAVPLNKPRLRGEQLLLFGFKYSGINLAIKGMCYSTLVLLLEHS